MIIARVMIDCLLNRHRSYRISHTITLKTTLLLYLSLTVGVLASALEGWWIFVPPLPRREASQVLWTTKMTSAYGISPGWILLDRREATQEVRLLIGSSRKLAFIGRGPDMRPLPMSTTSGHQAPDTEKPHQNRVDSLGVCQALSSGKYRIRLLRVTTGSEGLPSFPCSEVKHLRVGGEASHVLRLQCMKPKPSGYSSNRTQGVVAGLEAIGESSFSVHVLKSRL